VSKAILDEIGGVLARKFNWPHDDVADARKWITEIARTATPAVQLDVIKEDPADNRILECAVAAGSDYIVSGDNDLLRLGWYDGIKILSVSDFWDSPRREDSSVSLVFTTKATQRRKRSRGGRSVNGAAWRDCLLGYMARLAGFV